MLLLATPVSGATWLVYPDGSGDAPTIQAAIEMAQEGDLILVAPGRYRERLDTLGKDLTIRAMGEAGRTVVDAESLGSALTCRTFESPSTLLEGLTFTGGNGTVLARGRQLRYGGGVLLLSASPTLRRCVVEGNGANVGGGIYALDSAARLEGVTLRGNAAGRGGGLAAEEAQGLLLEDCTVSDNLAVFGGALWVEAQSLVRLEGGRFAGNAATRGGFLDAAQSEVVATGLLVEDAVSSEGCLALLNGATLRLRSATVVRPGWWADPYLVRLEGGALLECRATILWEAQCEILAACLGGQVLLQCVDLFPPVELPQCAELDRVFHQDPLFCAPETGDYRLRSDSPCTEENAPAGCGLLGAFPVGCEAPTPRIPLSWGRLKIRFLGVFPQRAGR
jgi:hypothetical protein